MKQLKQSQSGMKLSLAQLSPNLFTFYIFSQFLFTTFVNNYSTTFVKIFCLHFLFTTLAQKICSELLFATFVYNCCSHLLFTTFSQLLFTTSVYNFCLKFSSQPSLTFSSQLLFSTFVCNLAQLQPQLVLCSCLKKPKIVIWDSQRYSKIVV